jgi:hypothetical protein
MRIVLLIANVGYLVGLAYVAATKRGPSLHDPGFWAFCGMLLTLGLNVIYLLRSGRLAKGRILQLIGLWMDAKESELRRRVSRSQGE